MRNSRVLVCGGRDYDDIKRLFAVLDDLRYTLGRMDIIHGGAKGADSAAGTYAWSRGLVQRIYRPNWRPEGRYDPTAGFNRNIEMLEEEHPDLVVAFPGGNGTTHMVRTAKERGYKVMEVPKE